MDLITGLRRGGANKFGFHLGVVPASVVQLQGVQHWRGRGGRNRGNLVNQRGCEHHKAVRPVDVVLHNFVVEHHDARQCCLNSQARLHLGGAEARGLGLPAGENAEKYLLTDTQP